jgi:hypothetical protein
MLRSHAGAARSARNWGLARCQERCQAERSWYPAIDLHRLWNAEKKADPALSCPGPVLVWTISSPAWTRPSVITRR